MCLAYQIQKPQYDAGKYGSIYTSYKANRVQSCKSIFTYFYGLVGYLRVVFVQEYSVYSKLESTTPVDIVEARLFNFLFISKKKTL